MVQPSRNWSWSLGLAGLLSGCAIAFSGNHALAQSNIVPDDTLGAERSVTIHLDPDLPVDVINGGAIRGANLFHSFREFNVSEGRGAYFFSPSSDIQNILARVTGRNFSEILGTLGTFGNSNPNLFLINPNGIVFGSNARLDIGASFFASTASRFKFSDGSEFSAINPEAPPLLIINLTPGVQYGESQPETTITNRGNLVVGQDLTLAAGNLDLQGQLVAGRDLTLQATNTVRMRDSPTSPFIASSGGKLLVEGNQRVDIFALNHPDSGLFSGGNMVLRSASQVGGDAHYWSGGSFRIEKLDGSLGDLYSPYDPIIRSLGDVSFLAYQGTSLHILAGGSVNIGTVVITGAETGAAGVDYLQETVRLSNGREVSINGRLQPTLDIRAGVNPAFIGVPGVRGVNFPIDRFFGQGSLTDTPTTADITIGDVVINPPNGLVFITNQYQPNTALSGGDISLTDAGVFGVGIGTFSSVGNSGNIILDSRNDIVITNNSNNLAFGIFSNSYSDVSNGGDIILLAQNAVSLTNSLLLVQTTGAGKAGDINIAVRHLLVTNSALVSSTSGEGNGGNIIINASESVQVSGILVDDQAPSSLFASSSGSGKAGNVEITTKNLLVRDGALVSTDAVSEGDGGSIIINASESVQVIGTSADGRFFSYLSASSFGSGKAGNLEITTSNLLIADGGMVNAITAGEGEGGSIIINASDSVQMLGESTDGKFSSQLLASSRSFSSGKAGNIEIITTDLLVADGAIVSASTRNEREGGNVIIDASGFVQVIGRSADGQSSSGLGTQTFGTGKAGNIEITATDFLVSDGAQVSVSTFGEGNGGSLIVNASETVQLIGISADSMLPSGLFAGTKSTGDGGNVEITTPWLLLKDGAVVNVSTLGEGNAGSLIVNASQAVQLIGTSANGKFVSGLGGETSGIGDGGNVELTTPWLLVTDGAVVSAATFSQGKGGSLIVNASEQVQLSGRGGLFVDATAGGTAGDLIVSTNEMSVTDGARVTVSSPQGQAGNLSITTNSLTLNRGTISAETAKSDAAEGGANITLSDLDFLLLENESLISASALRNANGGNVTIDSRFIIATPPTGSEGSDIIANAEQGNGGRVNVTTQGLLGIQFRPRRTPKNDITVSSEFGLAGEFVLNQPNIDPSRGLGELPLNLVDAENQLDRTCSSGGAATTSSFVVTGRGGIPPAPTDPLDSPAVASEWVSLDSEQQRNNIIVPDANSTHPTSQAIIEAQGWVKTRDGQVILVAQSPTATLYNSWRTTPSCQDLKAK